MRRLLGVELTRLRSRRAVVLLVLAAVVLPALLAAQLAWDTRPVGAADRADARAQAEMAGRADDVQRELRTCLRDPTAYLGDDGTASACEEQILPRPEWFLARSPLRPAELVDGVGSAVAVLVVALLLIAGTTFAGGDWASGSMGNQLLYDARRTRVWAAKALAVLLGAAVAGIVALAAFWGPVLLVAAGRGIAVSDATYQAVGGHVGRTLALAAVAPVVGYAATMLFRHTVATLAVLFGLSVGAEVLLGLLPVTGTGRFSPSTLTFAWLQGRTTYVDPALRCPLGDQCDQLRTLTMWPAGATMAVVVAAVALLSWWSFRLRDVP